MRPFGKRRVAIHLGLTVKGRIARLDIVPLLDWAGPL